MERWCAQLCTSGWVGWRAQWPHQAGLSSHAARAEGRTAHYSQDAEAAGADGGAGGGAAAGAVDWDAKDVDVPAEPLAAPAPHPHAACDYVVKAGPHELLRALYGPDAPIADKVNALEVGARGGAGGCQGVRAWGCGGARAWGPAGVSLASSSTQHATAGRYCSGHNRAQHLPLRRGLLPPTTCSPNRSCLEPPPPSLCPSLHPQQMTDYKCGEWGPDPDGKALTQRTVSYLKPTPVGPTPVQSVQKVRGGWGRWAQKVRERGRWAQKMRERGRWVQKRCGSGRGRAREETAHLVSGFGWVGGGIPSVPSPSTSP